MYVAAVGAAFDFGNEISVDANNSAYASEIPASAKVARIIAPFDAEAVNLLIYR